MISLPEVTIFQSLRYMKDFLRADYIARSDKDRSFIHRVLGSQNATGSLKVDNRWTLAEMAVNLFVSPDGTVRDLSLALNYTPTVAQPPQISILLPADSEVMSGIGSPADEPPYENGDGTRTEKVMTFFRANYQLLVLSDNVWEVVMLYHLTRAWLLSNRASLEQQQLQDITFTGADFQLNSDVVPVNFFYRLIGLELTYTLVAPEPQRNSTFGTIEFTNMPYL